MKKPLVVLLGAAALAACATPPADGAQPSARAAASSGRQCFWAHQVSGFNALDERTVDVRVGARDIYRLDLLGPCNDIDWAMKIGIQSRGSSMICAGHDADIIAPSSLGPRRCAVRSVRKLTPEEVAGLKEKP